MSVSGWQLAAPAPLALAALLASLAGCGGGARERIVAHAGAASISQAQLAQRMVALAPEGVVPDAPHFATCVRQKQAQTLVHAPTAQLRRECRQQFDALQRQALTSLIVSRWLIGEAVERRLLPSQAAESEASLRAAADSAERKLRVLIGATEPRVSRAQAVVYYRAHGREFARQELRYVDLAENFASPAGAAVAKRRIEAAGGGTAGLPLREVVERFNTSGRANTTEAGKNAIFSARAGVLGGPVKLTNDYVLFEVVRIVAPVRRPFAGVERAIMQRLQREQQQRSLAGFIAAWRAKWRARTSCAPGYVVPACGNYHGAVGREDALTFD